MTDQTRAAALAGRVHDASTDFAGFADTLTPEQWTTIAVNNPDLIVGAEDEDRAVGVVVHHVADWLVRITAVVEAIVAGTDQPTITMDIINEINRDHASHNPAPDQRATVALVRSAGDAAAAVVARLTDEQLDRPRPSRAPTTQAFIEQVMIGHFGWHRGSIAATIDPRQAG